MRVREPWLPSRELLTGFLLVGRNASFVLDEQLDLLEEEFRDAVERALSAADAAIFFAHANFRLAPVTIRYPGTYEAQIRAAAPVEWDELAEVKRLFPNADGRAR